MGSRSRRAPAVAALALAAVLLGGPGAAGAQSGLSGGELQRLAERARHDPTALARLRAVRSVDGRPARLDLALAGADAADLDRRLVTMAGNGGTGSTGGAADAVRRQASDVLEGRRFQPRDDPRPLRGFFRWLGERVRPLEGPLRPVLGPLATAWGALTAGGVWSLLLGALVTVGAALLCLRLVRRRTHGVDAVGRLGGPGARGRDPATLEREAEDAERAGRLEQAVRLRFLAGLLRLDAQGTVELRPSLTSGELRRALPGPSVRDLTAAFEEIAYGGRAAGPDDVAQARREWPRVLAGAGKR